jgi:hypothetical protein
MFLAVYLGMKKENKTMERETDIFDLPSEEFDKLIADLPTTLHHPKPYYPPKTLDAYVRMITCGKRK